MSNLSVEFVVILGKRGFGKSQWLKQFSKGHHRKFIFDPTYTMPWPFIDYDEFMDLLINNDFMPGKNFSYATVDSDLVPLMTACGINFGNVLVAIDEASLVFTNPREALPKWASDATLLGRHLKLTVAIAAQRATSIPITMRSQASRLVSFRQTEKADLAALSEWFGERVIELPELHELQCLESDARGNITKYTIPYVKN